MNLLEVSTESKLKELKSFIKICSGWLSAPLFLVFWFADIIYAPHYTYEFLFLRVITVCLCLVVHYRIDKADTAIKAEILGIIYVFANSMAISIMIGLTSLGLSPYYAGLNLITTGIVTFIPWSHVALFIVIAVIYTPIFFMCAYSLMIGSDPSQVIVNGFFMIGTIVVSVVIRFFTQKLRNREISIQYKLAKEIESREKTILKKTEEELKLRTLANQFSPQVVEAIHSGRLTINQSIHISEVCALFVDIVDSTKKITILPINAVETVLKQFIEDVTKVMLKYDITIDKFLGDGILGFCNDPVQYPEFVERTVNAAVEILEVIEFNKDLYAGSWQHPLDIRIGISKGFASVGFYGSSYGFRSYTAIGRVINLASRLSDFASPNKIVVSSDIAQLITASDLKIEDLGVHEMKGFQPMRIYQLERHPDSKDYDPNEANICLTCNSVMHIVMDHKGLYDFKCRNCDRENVSPGAC